MAARASTRSLTSCFAHFGIEVVNPRNIWSAVAPDGRVVVTLWTDQFRDLESLNFYSTKAHSDLQKWSKRKLNRVRIENLSKAGVGGVFSSILITNKPTSSGGQRIVKREIGPLMRLTELNLETGEFTAERIN